VIDVALDDQEIAWRQGDDESGGKGVDITLSIVKRKTIAIYRLGAKLSFLQVSCAQWLCSQNQTINEDLFI